MDGDLKNDIIIYRPNTGYWYILRSSDQTVQTRLWGISEDIPVTGDYDGDFRDDIAVFRPSTGAVYSAKFQWNDASVEFWTTDGYPAALSGHSLM